MNSIWFPRINSSSLKIIHGKTDGIVNSRIFPCNLTTSFCFPAFSTSYVHLFRDLIGSSFIWLTILTISFYYLIKNHTWWRWLSMIRREILKRGSIIRRLCLKDWFRRYHLDKQSLPKEAGASVSEERMDGTSGFLRQKEQLGDKQPQINHSKTKYRHVNTQDDQTHKEDFTDVNIKKKLHEGLSKIRRKTVLTLSSEAEFLLFLWIN